MRVRQQVSRWGSWWFLGVTRLQRLGELVLTGETGLVLRSKQQLNSTSQGSGSSGIGGPRPEDPQDVAVRAVRMSLLFSPGERMDPHPCALHAGSRAQCGSEGLSEWGAGLARAQQHLIPGCH